MKQYLLEERRAKICEYMLKQPRTDVEFRVGGALNIFEALTYSIFRVAQNVSAETVFADMLIMNPIFIKTQTAVCFVENKK